MWGATRDKGDQFRFSIVSIHAPVWGATCVEISQLPRLDVSIHAPVWGATKVFFTTDEIATFQSTHPCGVRRGAFRFFRIVVGFNPRTRVGCDSRPCPFSDSLIAFQSTHPCGVRPQNLQLLGTPSVSIHAPVWGATKPLNSLICLKQFQSTHPCGVRPVDGL